MRRICDLGFPLLETVKEKILRYSVSNEIISLYNSNVSSSFGSLVTLIERKKKMSNMLIVAY